MPDMRDPQERARVDRDLFKRYEQALNTIAQQMCLCEELNDNNDSDDDDECGSCIANRTLDGLKKGEV